MMNLTLNNEVMNMITKYGFGKTVPVDFECVIDVVSEAVQAENFYVNRH